MVMRIRDFFGAVRPAKSIEQKMTRPLYHLNRRTGRHLERTDNVVIMFLKRLQQIIKVTMIRHTRTAKRPVVIAAAVVVGKMQMSGPFRKGIDILFETVVGMASRKASV